MRTPSLSHELVLEIGMEATGHYRLALYFFLVKNHFVVHVVNPIQTDSWRNSPRILLHKTDKIYSLVIADFEDIPSDKAKNSFGITIQP